MHVSDINGYDSHSVVNELEAGYCLISLGANTSSLWGWPTATLCRSRVFLLQYGISIVTSSPIYRTRPHSGAGLMPDFYNLVVLARTTLSTGSLLRSLKSIERSAGRRVQPRWSARPLDLDLLDHGGRIINWPALTRLGGPLVLPHPLMHRRGFVLVPLADIAPHWRHPVLGVTAADLLKRDPWLRRGITPA